MSMSKTSLADISSLMRFSIKNQFRVSNTKKYEILRTYFGISGIKLQQPKSIKGEKLDKKVPLKKLRRQMIDEGHVIIPYKESYL